MDLNDQEIERALRAAPRPKAPAGLRARLVGQAQSASARAAARAAVSGYTPAPGWLRRYWAVFLPGAACLACSVEFAVQQNEINELKVAVQTLSVRADSPTAAGESSGSQDQGNIPAAGASDAQQQELARLRAMAAQLTTELQGLEQVRTENVNLRAAVSAAAASTVSTAETEAITKAKERADRVRCINNLKQLDLCAIMWSADHGDVLPPDFAAMTNYMGGNLEILACPSEPKVRETSGDLYRRPAVGSSYQYLAASSTNHDPTQVVFYCPFHGNIAFGDGHVESVPILVQHPECLVKRDGKTYLQGPSAGQP
jgi:prepilin-type processing-associated H-X9-DG protein